MSTIRNKGIWTIWMALLVLAAMIATPALAQHRGPGGHRGQGMMQGPGHERPFAELDLTQEQKEQMREIHTKQADAHRETLEQLHEARLALSEQVHAPVLDEGAIRDKAAVVAAIEVDLAVTRAKAVQQVRGVLTPEQRDKLTEVLSKRREVAGKHGRRGIRGRHGLGIDGPEGF